MLSTRHAKDTLFKLNAGCLASLLLVIIIIIITIIIIIIIIIGPFDFLLFRFHCALLSRSMTWGGK